MNKVILLLFLFFSPLNSFEYQLSICAIFQNEAPYLKEWIDYHQNVGVEHFWLYNNNSYDGYLEVLEEYIKDGLVTLIHWPSIQESNDFNNYSKNVQPRVYDHGINQAKGKSKWVAFIDIDEFIIPIREKNITKILDNYENYAGVCVNWQCYGTSNIILNPQDSILKNLVMKMKWDAQWNHFIKSIVRPEKVVRCIDAHHFQYVNGILAVDTACNPVTFSCSDAINIDILRINHYWTRDISYFFSKKVARYERWGNYLGDVFKHADAMNEEYDPILAY